MQFCLDDLQYEEASWVNMSLLVAKRNDEGNCEDRRTGGNQLGEFDPRIGGAQTLNSGAKDGRGYTDDKTDENDCGLGNYLS